MTSCPYGNVLWRGRRRWFSLPLLSSQGWEEAPSRPCWVSFHELVCGITPMEPESGVYSSSSVLDREGQGTAKKRSQLQVVIDSQDKLICVPYLWTLNTHWERQLNGLCCLLPKAVCLFEERLVLCRVFKISTLGFYRAQLLISKGFSYSTTLCSFFFFLHPFSCVYVHELGEWGSLLPWFECACSHSASYGWIR